MRFPRATIFLIMVLMTAVTEGNASEPCGGRVISIGDSSADLIMKCGQPDWRQSSRETVIDRTDKDRTEKEAVTIDVWTYNFGPDRLIRSFTLENSIITDIGTGGYGHAATGRADRSGCGDRIVSLGESQGVVYLKCGEPAWKATRDEDLIERISDERVRKSTVTIDEWTYNFGPDRLVRILTFTNGTITDVRTGGYGF